jgi:hypothetical protein
MRVMTGFTAPCDAKLDQESLGKTSFLPFFYASRLSKVRHAQTEQCYASVDILNSRIQGYAIIGIKQMKWHTGFSPCQI